MSEPLNMPRVGSRRWIAWTLTRLAHRLFDADYYERILINDADGDTIFEAIICGDLYGGGVSSIYGVLGESIPHGATVHWDDDYKPDWLDEQ